MRQKCPRIIVNPLMRRITLLNSRSGGVGSTCAVKRTFLILSPSLRSVQLAKVIGAFWKNQ
jgi:hypothetical protein